MKQKLLQKLREDFEKARCNVDGSVDEQFYEIIFAWRDYAVNSNHFDWIPHCDNLATEAMVCEQKIRNVLGIFPNTK